MEKTNSYLNRKFYRCIGPKVGRMQPRLPKRQKNLLFFKYVEGRVLLVLLLDEDLVFFYFQPTCTLLQSYTWDVLQNGQNAFNSLRQVFFQMERLDQSKYNLQNNLLQIRFNDPSELQANVKLQSVPKTTGHRKAELSGVQVLSEQMDRRYSDIQLVLTEKQRALEVLRQELETIQRQRTKKQQVQKQKQFISWQGRTCKKRRLIEIDLLDE